MKKEMTQKEFARLGGNAILKKYGIEYYRELGRRGKGKPKKRKNKGI